MQGIFARKGAEAALAAPAVAPGQALLALPEDEGAPGGNSSNHVVAVVVVVVVVASLGP